MAQRTDIHAPASIDFDPELYVCVGVFDTEPEAGDGMRRSRAIQHQRAQGVEFAAHVGSRHVCGHCGHALRYVALMVRSDVNEMIYVGQDCLANRFEELTKGEFDRLRRDAQLNRERTKLADKRDAFVAAHPFAGELLAADNAGETWGFLADIAAKLRAYGELSDRQLAAAERVLTESRRKETERVEREVAEAAAKASGAVEAAPAGKLVITGEVLSVRFVSNPYGPGGSVKGLLKDDRGFKVWVTIPAAIEAYTDKGSRVSMTATLKPSDDDAYFAYGSRPSKAALV